MAEVLLIASQAVQLLLVSPRRSPLPRQKHTSFNYEKMQWRDFEAKLWATNATFSARFQSSATPCVIYTYLAASECGNSSHPIGSASCMLEAEDAGDQQAKSCHTAHHGGYESSNVSNGVIVP